MPINEQLQFKLDRSVGNLERCFYATASLSLRVAVAVAVGVVVFWTNVDFFVVGIFVVFELSGLWASEEIRRDGLSHVRPDNATYAPRRAWIG